MSSNLNIGRIHKTKYIISQFIVQFTVEQKANFLYIFQQIISYAAITYTAYIHKMGKLAMVLSLIFFPLK